MKKFAMVMIVLTCFFYTGLAGAHCGVCGKGKDPEAYVDKKMKKMTKKLKLDAEQQKVVRSALEKKVEAKNKVYEETHAKMKPISEEYRQTVRGTLKEDQKKKYDEMVAKWDKKRKKGGKGSCSACSK